jgi:hypothetical protein
MKRFFYIYCTQDVRTQSFAVASVCCVPCSVLLIACRKHGAHSAQSNKEDKWAVHTSINVV